jgi:hypothetical protein
MPNWCFNGVTLRHKDPAMIDRAQHSEGLLMEFLPTPQALRDTVSGSVSENKRAEHEAQQARNLEQYGAKDWYDWNIANWGTKWDVTLENVDRVDEYTLNAAFDSAWSPPIEAYRRLEDMGFEIEAKFYEPGMAFVGTYDTENGEFSIDISGFTSDTVREAIGEELDDYFGISEEKAQYEDEENLEIDLDGGLSATNE